MGGRKGRSKEYILSVWWDSLWNPKHTTDWLINLELKLYRLASFIFLCTFKGSQSPIGSVPNYLAHMWIQLSPSSSSSFSPNLVLVIQYQESLVASWRNLPVENPVFPNLCWCSHLYLELLSQPPTLGLSLRVIIPKKPSFYPPSLSLK